MVRQGNYKETFEGEVKIFNARSARAVDGRCGVWPTSGMDWQPKESKGETNSMIEATQYPMAFDELEKGSIISAEEVERITGFKRCQTAHGMAVMKLVNQIAERLEERELYVIVRQEKGALHILDDPNGSAHAYGEFLRHARGCGRNLRRMGKVDVSKLNGTEARDHENRVMIAASGYAGLRKGMKAAQFELKNPPSVPGLLPEPV